jgi:hypothetical protein
MHLTAVVNLISDKPFLFPQCHGVDVLLLGTKSSE